MLYLFFFPNLFVFLVFEIPKRRGKSNNHMVGYTVYVIVFIGLQYTCTDLHRLPVQTKPAPHQLTSAAGLGPITSLLLVGTAGYHLYLQWVPLRYTHTHTHTHTPLRNSSPSFESDCSLRKNFQHVRHVASRVHFKNSDPHFFSFSYSVSMVLMDNIPGPFAMLQMLTVFFLCVCVCFLRGYSCWYQLLSWC